MKKKFLLAGAMGISGGLLYLLSRSGKLRSTKAARMGREEKEDSAGNEQPQAVSSSIAEPDHILDDHGTDQAEAAHILTHIRDAAFEASNEKLALALGRPTEEIEEWTRGAGIIDGDVVLKARGLAMQRGIESV
jgi:hypothetical protein